MHVELGWTYKFKFITGFESLNNIYTVVKIYSYDEFLAEGLTLIDLYTSVGKDADDLENDLLTEEYNYTTQEIYKLRHPEYYDSVIYVPEGIISEIPNFNIKKYSNVAVAMNLGVYPGDETFSAIREIMSEHMESQLGYADTADLITIGHVWLTDQEYSNLQAEREVNKKNVINYFSECKNLRESNTKLNSIIDNYEKLFKSWIDSKGTKIDDNSQTQYIRVDTDELRFKLAKSTTNNGDMVEVLSTRSVYKVVDNENLKSELGYYLYDISDPTYIVVTTEQDKLNLTTADVQVNDRVKVNDSKSLYKVVDLSKLGTEEGFLLELVEKTLTNDPKFISVANNEQRFALTKKRVDEQDYVFVLSTGYLYTVISTVDLSLESSYEVIGKVATDSRLMRVKTEKEKFLLTIDQISTNDCVLVEESNTLYTVIDPANLDNEDGYIIEFVEKVVDIYPRFVTVETDEQKFLLSRRHVSVNDRVLVTRTNTIYKIIDESKLMTQDGYVLEYKIN